MTGVAVAVVPRPVPIPRNPVRALASPYLWLATVQLASDVFTAGALGVLVVLGAGVSFVSLPLMLIGVPVWLLPVGLLSLVSALERTRFGLTLGMLIRPPRLPARGGRSWTGWSRELAGSGTVGRQLAYFVLLVPLSLINLAGVLLAWSVPPALVVLPFYDPSFFMRHPSIVGFGVADRASAWIVSGAALTFLVFVSPQIVRGLSCVDAALAGRLLGPSRDGELTEAVDRLEISRRRVVHSAEDERRRIERDLHDGAQQRLVSVAMTLGRARKRLSDDSDRTTRDLVEQAHDEAKEAIVELRDLTRGLHPPVLTDRGLDAALSAVAARAPIPVSVDVQAAPRPSATIEALAYFVVTEALTNVAKHADATRASVVIRREADVLRIVVRDDGVGGADPTRGSGLAGLSDRVSGVDGRLEVASPPGGPTVVTAEVPCES